MSRGGARKGAGRKRLPLEEKRQTHSVVANKREWEPIKEFVQKVKKDKDFVERYKAFLNEYQKKAGKE